MHVCFVENGYPHSHGGGGGAGTRIQLIARELVRRGYAVTVITAYCDQCPQINHDGEVVIYRQTRPASFHWYWSKLPIIGPSSLSVRYLEWGWGYRRLLNQLHKQKPIDLVEYAEGGDFWHAWMAPFAQISSLDGSRYTFLKESNRPVTQCDWWHRRLELTFMRRVDHIISPSQAIVDAVQRELGTSLSHVTVLPNPIDPRLLMTPTDVEHDESPMVLFAARNDWVKGGDILLQAVATVVASFPEVRFEFFGYTAPAHAPIPEQVIFHPFVSKDQLLSYYQHATICVIPSRWDNSPNTVYEAMAAGKAVVATRVGGIPEIVIDGETGLLVEPNNPDQLATALIHLLGNTTLRTRMGKNGRLRVQQIADLTQHVDARISLYHQLAELAA